ncbi:MAG: DEAD/DEAH box helicase family protein [Candidatus Heimdallarchaeota archaeon]|nr:DEAD/DEAH box helicase family protein [Candidatus Heimdallarchaeota archaeon]
MSHVRMQDYTWEDFFPYEPRQMQMGMIRVINAFIQKNTHMVLEASTGIGKTIVNLATVLPYAKKYGYKVIYTSRTHAQMDRVVEELQAIAEKTPVSGVAMRGREAFCLHEMVQKFATSSRAVQIMCKHLKTSKKCTYFNNFKNESLIEPVLRNLYKQPATSEYIFDIAESAQVCPAETVRKLLPEVDVIACSYLYLFDPEIRKSFLESLNIELKDVILIVDEAHNLPDMVNNVTSDNLNSFSLNRAKREAQRHGRDDFIKFYDSVDEYLSEMNKKLKLYEEKELDAGIVLEELELDCGIELDDEFFSDMIILGETIRFNAAKSGKDPRSSVGRVGEFFFKWYDSIGSNDFSYSMEKKMFGEASNKRDTFTTLNLNALDPSRGIFPVLSNIETSLSVTGTLGDPSAFTMVTGLSRLSHMTNIFPSPYDRKNILTLVPDTLTTLYKMRTGDMYTKMAQAINAIATETPANVGLFTPSYAILEEILIHGLRDYSPKEIMVAKSGMKSKENDELVERFKKRADRGGAILCTVLGGRSSEGADFPGDTMNTVIIVGIPYAPPTVNVNAQIKYMDAKFPGKGRILSYQIPAINRAAQAAGRPVRSLEDKALIVLMDYRYAQPQVADKLPNWIRSAIVKSPADPSVLASKTRDFYKAHGMY